MALEILTPDEMARVDARATELGVATRTLMENAGRAVAEAIIARWTPRETIVLCGPGNNGGDGYVAARLLAGAGWPVHVAALGRDRLKGDAADAAAAWTGSTQALRADCVHEGHLVVDALFGVGLTRPLEGEAAAVARALADHHGPVVAVDTPSGAPGDGKEPSGPVPQATVTVTFCRKKPVHVLLPGRALCGEVVVADIGVPEQAVADAQAQIWENDPALWAHDFVWPDLASHKHARGKLAVASGGPWNTGAARLAARAGLRVGAGLVTLHSPPAALAVNAAHLTAVMLAPFAEPSALGQVAATTDALAIGPAFGVGAAAREAVAACAAAGRGLVLDADALTSFAEEPPALFALLHPNCVLTPHPGEFRRLFADLAAAPVSKVERTRAAAARAGCVALLKGADTVIARPDGATVVNTNGTSFLATAGAGDVLTGLIAGLLAQGMTAWPAACAGAWLHGACADALGPGLIAEDLCEAIPAALRRLKPPA